MTEAKLRETDGVTFDDIGKLMPDEVIDTVRFITIGSTHGYRPKPVRRKEIPNLTTQQKPGRWESPASGTDWYNNVSSRSWSRFVKRKFSENSYGFRPNRSAENAIARAEFLIQNTRLHYVVEFDVKGFFDNVDHSKLIKQIWSLGIRDKKSPVRAETDS